MSGFLYSALIALIGLLNPIFIALNVPQFFTWFHSSYSQIMTADVINYLKDTMSIIYYFFPKSVIATLLGCSAVILAIRIGLSIWQAIKW